MKYRLKKDTLYELNMTRYPHRAIFFTLNAGEECEYFAHSKTFLFKARKLFVPFFSERTVITNPEWFEPINEDE